MKVTTRRVGRTFRSAADLPVGSGGTGTSRADQEVRPTLRMYAWWATFGGAADCQSASATYAVQNIRGTQLAVRRPIGNRPQVGNPPHIKTPFFMEFRRPQAVRNRRQKPNVCPTFVFYAGVYVPAAATAMLV